jgi:hypothetical protein
MEGTATPPPVAQTTHRAPIPWEDPARTRFFDRFLETVKLLATAPAEAFARMPTTGGIARPLTFAIVVGWIGIAVYALWMLLFGGMSLPFVDQSQLGEVGAAFGFSAGFTIMLMVLAPVFVIIGVFFQAAILHVMLMLVGGANHGFETTTRVCSYAQASQLAQIVPICGGLLAAVWSVILLIIGLSTAHGITRGKAALAVIIPVVLCCVFMVGMMLMGALAGVATSQ